MGLIPIILGLRNYLRTPLPVVWRLARTLHHIATCARRDVCTGRRACESFHIWGGLTGQSGCVPARGSVRLVHVGSGSIGRAGSMTKRLMDAVRDALSNGFRPIQNSRVHDQAIREAPTCTMLYARADHSATHRTLRTPRTLNADNPR